MGIHAFQLKQAIIAVCTFFMVMTGFIVVDGSINESLALTTPDCRVCHGGGVPGDFTYRHHQYGIACAYCHGTIIGDAPDYDCISCHRPGWKGVDVTTAHAPLHDMTDVPDPVVCAAACHNPLVIPEHQKSTLFDTPSGEMDCDRCHLNTNTDPLAGAVNVQSTILTGSGPDGQTVVCTQCHTNIPPAGHADSHDNVLPDPQGGCDATGCHNSNVMTEHTDRNWTCSTCHEGQTLSLDPGTVMTVIQDSSSTNPNPQTRYCTDCHTAFADHAADHDQAFFLLNPSTQDCTRCHAATDPALEPNRANLVDEHLTNQFLECVTCHDRTDHVFDAIDKGRGPSNMPVYCVDCHTDATTGQGTGHNPIGAEAEPWNICVNCHFIDVFGHELHDSHLVFTQEIQQDCAVCHVPGGSRPDCIQCHSLEQNSYNWYMSLTRPGPTSLDMIGPGTEDHDKHTAAGGPLAGDCTYCHVSGIPGSEPLAAPYDECRKCHDGSVAPRDFSYGTDIHTVGHIQGAEADGQSCAYCHSQTPACTDCHQIDGPNNTQHDTHTDTLQYTCTECHVNGIAGSEPLPEPYDQCSVCHSPNGQPLVGSDITFGSFIHTTNHITAGDATPQGCDYCHGAVDPAPACTTCHDIAGPFTPKHDFHTDTQLIDCALCHVSTVNHTITESAGCIVCHTTLNGSFAGIETIHNVPTNGVDACSTCHRSNRQEVIDAITAGPPVDCSSCHTPHDFTVNHTITETAGCASCHTALDGGETGIEATHDTNRNGAGSCATCHNSTDSTTQDIITNGTADTLSCADCHAAHTFADSHTITETAGCNSCHTPPLDGTEAGIEAIHNTDRNGAGSCATCHNSADATTQGYITNGTADTLACADCHAAHDFADSHTINESTGCASCHTPPLDGTEAGIEAIHNTDRNGAGSCATCHNSADATTQGYITNGTADTLACADCHAAHTFVDSHTITETEGCISCHTSLNGGETGIEATHDTDRNGAGSCATCHNSADATTQGFITNGTADTLSCADCHAPHTFVDSHSITETAGCISCHTSLNGGETGIEATHDTDRNGAGSCATCHNSADATTQGYITNGTVDTLTCVDCHAAHTFVDSHTISETAGCISCHTSLNGGETGIEATHDTDRNGAGSCATCHNSTDATTQGFITDGAANTLNCSSCHVAHDAGTDHDMFSETGCANCHGDPDTTGYRTSPWPIEQLMAIHDTPANGSGSCNTCHKSSEPYAINTIADGRSGVAVNCDSCHKRLPGTTNTIARHSSLLPSHSNIENDTYRDDNGCTACHLYEGFYTWVDPYSADPHPGCDACHQSTRQAVLDVVYNGPYQPYPTTIGCNLCHNNAEGSRHVPLDPPAQHDYLSAGQSCGTAGCHQGSFTYIEGLHEVTTNSSGPSCATCHNSTDSAVTTAIASGMASTPVDCANCHGADNHVFDTDHSISLPPVQFISECTNCHGGTSFSVEAVHDIPDNGAGTCATCHNSTRQQVIDVIAARAAVDCWACHVDHGTDAAGAAASHNFFADSSNCTSCHNTDTAEERLLAHPVSQVDSRSACYNCHHENASTVIKNTVAAGIAGTTVSCEDCHTGQTGGVSSHGITAADAAGIHNNLGATQTCAVCHTDKNSGTNFGYIVTYHPPLAVYGGSEIERCATCHTSTRTDVIDAIANGKGLNGEGIGCVDCHAATTHIAFEPNKIHDNIFVNTGSTCSNCHIANNETHTDMSTTAECSSCHVSSTQTEINTLHRDDCMTCHLSVRPEVRNTITAGIFGTPVNCSNCHGAHNFADSHTINESTGCASCHTPPLNGTEAGIEAIHNTDRNGAGSCATCHNSADATTRGFITNGTADTLSCADCHTPHSFTDSHTITETAGCASCHAALDGGETGIEATHDTNRNGAGSCATCHNSADATTQGFITNGTADTLSCADCHAAHTFVDSHTISETAGCISCHTTLNGQESGIEATHDTNRNGAGSCATCHNSADATTQNFINNGTVDTLNCADCHAAHDGTADHNMTVLTDTSCASCHVPNVYTEHVVNRTLTCTTCHTSTDPNVQGAITSGINGNPVPCQDCHGANAGDHLAAHDSVGVPSPGCTNCHDANVVTEHVTNRGLSCADCHDNATYDAVINAGIAGNPVTCYDCHGQNQHHTNANATSGNCAHCHSDPRPLTNDPQQLACRECHIDNNGFVQTSAPAPSHAFNTNGNIQDFGACFDCHAPVPYHAKPTQIPDCWTLNPSSPDYIADQVPGMGTFNLFSSEFRKPRKFYDNTSNESRAKDWCRDFDRDFDQLFASPQIPINMYSIVYQGQAVNIPVFDTQYDPFPNPSHNLINTVGNCANCHTVGEVVSVTHKNNCQACHMSTDQTVQSAISTGRSGTAVDCYTCHGSQDHVSAHDMTELTAPECAECHVPNVFNEHVANRTLTCSNCHSSTDPNVQNAIADGMNGQPVPCQDCHGASAGDHMAAHDSVGVPSAGCTNCHDANVVTEHVTNRGFACADCHNNAAYDSVIAAGQAGSFVTCYDCHGTNAHHDNANATSGNCAFCHADPRPLSNDPEQLACRECHIDNNGYVQTSSPAPSHAFNTQGNIQDFGACFDCHAPVPYHARTAQQQFDCWDTNPQSPTYDPSISLPGRGTFNLFYADNVKPDEYYRDTSNESLAKDYCRQNQNAYDRPEVSYSMYQIYYQGQAMDVPVFGSGYDPFPNPSHNRIDSVGNCGDCHTVGNVITVTHSNNCQACHMSTDPLVQDMISQALSGTNVNCYDCHGSQDHVSAHNMTELTEPSCSECHVGNVFTEHVVNRTLTCSNCHASTDQNVQNAIADGMNGTPVPCQDCHGANAGSHLAAHDNAGVPSTGCTNCHDANVVTEHVTNRAFSCNTCHTNTDPNVVNAINAGQAGTFVDCYDCHGTNTHHNATQALQGDCTYCHADPRIAIDPNAPTGQLACRECHTDNNGQVTATRANHRFNTQGAIQDFGACFACHAPTPYHAKPTSRPQDCNSTTPGKGTFNFFSSEFGGGSKSNRRNRSCDGRQGDYNNPTISFNMVTITAELSDNQTYSVPTFGSTGGGGGTEPPPGGGGGTGSEVDPNGTIIEAELYDVLGSNFDVRSDMSSASGDYLYATTNSTTSPSGSPVEYSLYFTETGTYFIDFLMNDNGSGGDNSLWYGVDGSLVGNVTSPGSNTNWNWANTPHSTGPNPSSITINSVGLHTVLIWARENGMRLDQFRLTREGGSSGGGGGSTNDSITITRADYSSRRDRVTIYAENSLGNDAQLTVNYNGDSYQMTWDSGDNRWELRISTSSCRDDQIEVTSSEGGNDTAYVSGCSN